MTRTGTFRYVRHADIERHHREGWMVDCDLGQPHGEWSVLMWRCDCFDMSEPAAPAADGCDCFDMSEPAAPAPPTGAGPARVAEPMTPK